MTDFAGSAGAGADPDSLDNLTAPGQLDGAAAPDGAADEHGADKHGADDLGARDDGARDDGARDDGARDDWAGDHGANGTAVPPARPKRAELTRAALLTAAGIVFAASGYTDASVDEIVERAGTSVGTLYHHFGSKADLYVRLYLDYQSRQHHRSARAFRNAVSGGETDPMVLFLTGTRAYLDGAWSDRHIGKIFVGGGGPPGFDGIVRRRFRDWLDINAAGFDQGTRPFSATRLLVLTAIVTEAGREVTGLSSRQDATDFIDEVVCLMGQLGPEPGDERAGPE